MTNSDRQLPGFPEWSPSEVLMEQHLIRAIRDRFEHHGFQPVDLAAVQPWNVLVAGDAQYSDGGLTKPIFDVREPAETSTNAALGLRYDLTVPLARYIVEHAENLSFPWHCYQINKVWRAEPTSSRHSREFYQCDVDIIGHWELSLLYDAEIACVLNAAFDRIGVAGFAVHISNRRVISALLSSHGVEADRASFVVRVIDDGGRQPADQTVAELVEGGLPKAAAEDLGRLLTAKTVTDARSLLDERNADPSGLDDLTTVMEAALAMGMPADRLKLDFSITRGHDYYTGTVYETFAVGREHWGAIGSGGRYDNLLGHITGDPYPGVGVSLGLTRLVGFLRSDAEARPSLDGDAKVVVVGDANPSDAIAALRELRSAGVPTLAMLDLPADAITTDFARDRQVQLVVAPSGRPGSVAVGQIGVDGSADVDLHDLLDTVVSYPAFHRYGG